MTRLLVTDQSRSNGLYSGTGGPWLYATDVKFWNNRGNLATLANIGTAFVNPTRDADPFGLASENSPALHIANAFQYLRNEPVRAALVALNSASMFHWMASGVPGDMYARTKAVWDATGLLGATDVVDGQGSSNETNFATFKQDKLDYYAKLVDDGVILSTAHITLLEQPPDCPNINGIFAELAAENANIYLAKTGNVPRVDSRHFTAGGCALVAGSVMETYLAVKT